LQINIQDRTEKSIVHSVYGGNCLFVVDFLAKATESFTVSTMDCSVVVANASSFNE